MSEVLVPMVSAQCSECSIIFGLSEATATAWKKSHKTFSCPNGCKQHYPKPNDDPKEKEIASLKEELKTVKEKLTIANETNQKQTALIEELKLEIEIWKPSTSK